MSDTPETDKRASGIIGFFSCETVPADLSRTLERDRDRLMMICQSAHDRLLRGDSDKEICDILAASWKEKL